MIKIARCLLLLMVFVTALYGCAFPIVNIQVTPAWVSVVQGESVTIQVNSTILECEDSATLPCVDFSGQVLDYFFPNLPTGVIASFDRSLQSADTPGLVLVTLDVAADAAPGIYEQITIALLQGQPLDTEEFAIGRFTLQIKARNGGDSTAAVTAIAAGGNTSYALLSDTTVRAWGSNRAGWLGDGSRILRTLPVVVSNLSNTERLVAGFGVAYHGFALQLDGTVRAWGDNGMNRTRLGVGLGSSGSTVPVPVAGLTTIQALATKQFHSLALLDDGTVMSWGNNQSGQLGVGDQDDRPLPVTIPGLNNVQAIAVGASHSLALLNDGTVMSWGANLFGELGIPLLVKLPIGPDQFVPIQIPNLTNVSTITAGVHHSLALLNDGTLMAWGWNEAGQLGDNTTINRTTPVAVQNLSNVIAIAAGDNHSLALTNDGRVWAWGDNNNGELGNASVGVRSLLPVQVPNLTNVTAIAAGGFHSLALLDCGTVRAWGGNQTGQLGNESFFDDSTANPLAVLNLGDSSVCPDVTLTASTTGNGSGTITTSDANLNCGRRCDSQSALVVRNNSVNLTANADSDSQFVRWDGDCAGTNASVNVVMDADKHCVAIFSSNAAPHHLLSVDQNGAGNGTITSSDGGVFGPENIDCGDVCNAVFPDATVVTLTATADNGSQFGGWQGACASSGSNPVAQVTMTGFRICVAFFSASDFMLTVNKNGPGDGRIIAVQPTFSEIDCGDFCTDFYPAGTEVILIPDSESQANFGGWNGCDQVTDNGCVINMNSDRSVTATFN